MRLTLSVAALLLALSHTYGAPLEPERRIDSKRPVAILPPAGLRNLQLLGPTS